MTSTPLALPVRQRQAIPEPAFDDSRSSESLNRSGELVRQILFVLALIFSIRYLVWRASGTLNPGALWFFALFLWAEIMGFVESALFYFTNWNLTHHKPRPVLRNRTVDVFITTYDEPLHIVRETAVCAVSMSYPHTTYILDDGKRPEIRELAEELGCQYITRKDHKDAKAGNLNNALFRGTDGEFIVLLDADHVPMPNLIEQTLGFFEDQGVAVVQTPQDFYNLDSFQHTTDWREGYAWQQQELFFSVIEPGKDYWNSALFCGSPAVVRRSALYEIGGFATGTITEDFHTSVRLQANNRRVLYFNKTLARGLAPQTFRFFAQQWLRWGVGAMQILRRENPLFRPGLTLPQKINFFASTYFYWMSYQKLILIFTPIFSLVSGIFPLQADIGSFWAYFGPAFLFNLAASVWLYRGFKGLLLMEQFTLIKLHVMIRSVLGFQRKERRFQVTPKAQGTASRLLDVWPQIGIVLWAGVSLLAGIGRLPGSAGFRLWAIAISMFWSFYFLALSLPVIRRALKKREMRIAYRFGSRLDAPVVFSGGGFSKPQKTFARNLNRHGLSLTLEAPIPIGTILEMTIQLPERELSATGQVVRQDKLEAGTQGVRYMNGIRFEQISSEAQDEVTKFLFTTIAPQQGRLLQLTSYSQNPIAFRSS